MAPRFRSTLLAALALAAPLVSTPADAQIPPPAAVGGGTSYADLTDLVIAAPVIADATIRSTVKLKGTDAAGVAPGFTRFYVEADVIALVRGAGGLPPRIGYLLDVAPDSAGRLPKLKKLRVLLFGRPVPGIANQIQLVAPDAQLAWTPADDQRVRAIAQALVAADAPPVVTGIGNAFHVAGALPGEGETQLFLTTANGAPVSLTILRRPGEQPRWAVALSEIVDEAAAPPARDTLLWYRLACALPRELPARSTASLDPADATIAREDYGLVLQQLGPCGRTRVIR
ncbi:hypothetical protein M9979_11320 [Sphingomonas sp. RP10(2022)]|uniref:Uncharacterized protein n=1 Tax=Sphingomonas liriopis TaxID=2949094 RepID=A0A9X2KQ76_9SPHN|nr:hypothetical protein [Sphingomonas liriopis]MCP3735459.1 hypothetical protein [Sphingomonas liriopis]